MQLSAQLACNKTSFVTLKDSLCSASDRKDKYPTILPLTSFSLCPFFFSPGSPIIFPDGLFTLHSFCLDSRKSSLYGTLGHKCVPLGCRSTHWNLIGTLGSLGSSRLALPTGHQANKMSYGAVDLDLTAFCSATLLTVFPFLIFLPCRNLIFKCETV